MGNENFQPSKPTGDKILDFFATTRWVWVLLAGLTTLLVWSGWLPIPDFQISGEIATMLIMAGASFVIFSIPAYKFIDRFYTPDYEFVFEVNAEEDDLVNLYAVGRNKLNEMDVKPNNKSMHSVRSARGQMKNYVRDLDAEELEATVNWNGMQEEAEMLRTQQKIKDVRIDRRKTLQKAMYVYTSLDRIIEEIQMSFYSDEAINVADLTGKLEDDVKHKMQAELGFEDDEDDAEQSNTAQELIDSLSNNDSGGDDATE